LSLRNEMQNFFRFLCKKPPSLPRPVFVPPPSVVPTDRGRDRESEAHLHSLSPCSYQSSELFAFIISLIDITIIFFLSSHDKTKKQNALLPDQPSIDHRAVLYLAVYLIYLITIKKIHSPYSPVKTTGAIKRGAKIKQGYSNVLPRF
jgi:hypothetical protein